MATKSSTAPKGGKKGGKKGKMPLGQRIVIGAAVLGLAWYLYTKQKNKKQAEEQKKIMGGGGPLGGYTGGGAVGGSGGNSGPIDPNTGLPCSQVFGGCPDGGININQPPSVNPSMTTFGCMSPTANNYNSAATVDDGSCDFTPSGDIYGCMDSTSNNYNPDATIQELSASDPSDPCTYDPVDVYGCMDQSANNYDASATIQQVSDIDTSDPCTYDGAQVFGCTDATATNYNASATDDDGSCTYGTVCDQAIDCWSDCPNPSSQTFTTASCGIVDDCGDSTGFPNSQAPMCANVQGCIDPTAVNYDPNATNDDGTCYYNPGCNDPSACNYDSLADYDDGSCQPTSFACGEATADNYNSSAGVNPCVAVDNASCVWQGCDDPTANNYDPQVNLNNNTCTYDPIDVYGCTDATASNYDPNANIDDGSCVGMPVFGCTNQAATNYNSLATNDDGSCAYADVSCDSCNDGYPTSSWEPGPTCPNGMIASGTGNPCSGQTVIGCGDPSANNYNPNVTQSDNSCTYTTYCYQCNGGSAVGNSFTTANCPNGWQDSVPTCNASVPDVSCDSCNNGYPTSQMYSGPNCPNGTIASGTGNPCSGQTVIGCGDPSANNYNPNVTQSDNSCTYTAQTVNCYQCNGSNVVGNQFSGSCPKGWSTNSSLQCGGGGPSKGTQQQGTQKQGTQQQQTNQSFASFMGFDGNDKGFGNWQRRMAGKVAIDDTDWNPIVS